MRQQTEKRFTNSLVMVSKGDDPYETTREVLQTFPLPVLKGRRVLIKPNAARVASPGQGVTTHPGVVAATIDLLQEREARRIVIGESCIFGVDPEEAFWVTGMKEVAEKRGIELFDLDRSDPAELAIPKGRVIKKIKVPAILREFEFIISIPVMKTHMHTQVTLSIKNMKGLLWRGQKARFHQLRYNDKITRGHQELDMAISEMASVLSPDLAIIDGTTGMEGMGPAYGKSKRTGMIVVGNHALSADAVASRLMGFDPAEVPHLKLSAEMGLGEIKPEKILIQPDDYLKWRIPFDPPPSELSIPFPDIVVHDEGSCSACLSTLLVFLQNYHSSLAGYRLEDEKIHIGVGKNLKTCPEGTILIGNCTHAIRKKGVFIQGCPPVASQVWLSLDRKRKAKNSSNF